MDWVGHPQSGYRGIDKKVMECFTDNAPFKVIIFLSESIDEVRRLKQKVRDINKMGYSSIHITDTRSEVQNIADLIFNDNGIHYLNHADYRRDNPIRNAVHEYGGNDDFDAVIDGSAVLELYGIRKSRDVDCICDSSTALESLRTIFPQAETHDETLKHHRLPKEKILYDQKNYFRLNKVKFTSFRQLMKMKQQRGEPKDRADCALMRGRIDKAKWRVFLARLQQRFCYFKIVLHSRVRASTIYMTRLLGIYGPVKSLYRRIKGRED